MPNDDPQQRSSTNSPSGCSVQSPSTTRRSGYSSRHFGDEDQLRVTSVLNRSVPSDVTGPVFAHGISKWTKPGRAEIDGPNLLSRLCAP